MFDHFTITVEDCEHAGLMTCSQQFRCCVILCSSVYLGRVFSLQLPLTKWSNIYSRVVESNLRQLLKRIALKLQTGSAALWVYRRLRQITRRTEAIVATHFQSIQECPGLPKFFMCRAWRNSQHVHSIYSDTLRWSYVLANSPGTVV